MAAPIMSHLICSMGLIVLILVMPVFFAMERDGIVEEMAKRELTEISDYVSNTLANLYILANSTSATGQLNITKNLLYLPLTVQNYFYKLSITPDGEYASKVTAVLKEKSWVAGESWLVPGLKMYNSSSIEILGQTLTAGCLRDSTGFYVWLGEGY